VYILISRPNFIREIRYAIVLLVAGLVLYFFRAFRRREWPWRAAPDGGAATLNSANSG
jgi:heme/copper-type cytochrome/quinol oxidase subunit 2